MTLRVIVIGAGVVGASVAWRATMAGVSVTVLEAGRPGGGTSACSFAWTNSNAKAPRGYHELNVAGMRAHAALAQEFGDTPWWHGSGCVEWEAPEDRAAQQARVARLREWDYAAEWITPQRLHELEPDLDLAQVGDAPIAFYADEGWLDAAVYIGAMLGAARDRGAAVLSDCRVTETLLRGGRMVGVAVADGRRFEADMVVNCAGRWANEPVSDAGLHLPMASTPGLLAYTPPVAARLHRVVRAPDIHVRPDGGGRVACIAPLEDVPPFQPQPDPGVPQARELMQRLRQVLPAVGPVEAEAVRMAIRPIPGDGYSAIGPVPRVEGYYLAITHSAVTLSAYVGAAVADEIVHNRPHAALAAFRPARFFN